MWPAMTRTWCGPVADPTIPKLFREVFKREQKRSEEDPFTLDWPDDTAGQGRCIRHLAEMAANPALPYEVQAWAFEKLEEIARDYHEVPIELLLWCRAVVAEEFDRPKQRRGRPGGQFAGRNRLIGDLIRWLRDRGETREAAIEQVAEAIDLPKATDHFGVSPETVKTILTQETEPDDKTVARRERLFQEYVDIVERRQRGEISQADIEGMKAVAAAVGVPLETVETILGRGEKIE